MTTSKIKIRKPYATEKEQAPLDPTQTAVLRDRVQTAVRDRMANRRERGRSMIFAYGRSRVRRECLRYPHNEGVGVSIKAYGLYLPQPKRPDLSEADLSLQTHIHAREYTYITCTYACVTLITRRKDLMPLTPRTQNLFVHPSASLRGIFFYVPLVLQIPPFPLHIIFSKRFLFNQTNE